MSADNSTSLIKDPFFQGGTSYAVFVIFVLYNVLNSSMDFDRISNTYPGVLSMTTPNGLHSYTAHVGWFVRLTFMMYVWTMVAMTFTLVLLLIVQYLVLFVVKFDSSVFKSMETNTPSASDTLLKMSEKYAADSRTQVTTSDIASLVFSFVVRAYFVFAGFIVGTIVLSLLFAIIVAPPSSMTTKNKRDANTRLFLIVLFVFIVIIAIMYSIATSRQSIQTSA